MNDLITFDYHESAVRVVTIDDAPWFVAADVATILGYDHSPSMVRLLDGDEADVHNLHSSGQTREMSIISESGLYNAIFRSRRDEAKAFRRWVTGTVLPELRRSGSYAIIDPARPTTEPLADVDCTRFSLALSAVALMRRLRGNAPALMLWDHLGLPRPDLGPDVDTDSLRDDLAQRVMMWSAERTGFTTDELADDIGLDRLDANTRRRIADALRLLGFDKKRKRVARRQLAWVWYRPQAEMAAEQGHGE